MLDVNVLVGLMEMESNVMVFRSFKISNLEKFSL